MSAEHPDQFPSRRPAPEPGPGPPPDAGPEPGSEVGAEVGGEAGGESGPEPAHDPGGLDLARSVARALGRSRRDASGRDRPGPAGARAFRRRGRRRSRDAQSSGAHPDERDPQTLDATIGRLVAEEGWGTDVAVHGVFGRWDQIVGREVAEHCHPERFADARLTVRTDSTAWATQVRLLAPTVVRRLNEELGDGTVTHIDVKGPNVPSWSKGFRSVRDGRGPRDTYG